MALSRKLSIASRRLSSYFILKGHYASLNRVPLPIHRPTPLQSLFYFGNYSISMTRSTSFNLNLSALAEKKEYKEVFTLKSVFSAMFELLGCTVRMSLKLVAVPVIKALSLSNEMDKALLLWKTMNAVGCKSDVSTYNALIAGMFRARDGDDGVNFYDRPLNSYDLTVNLCPGMVWEDSKGFPSPNPVCIGRRNTDGALQVFGQMQKQVLPDVVTYNTMIHGLCCFERGCKEAMEFYHEMIKDGVEADVMTYNILITGLCMTGKMQKVEEAYHLSNVMVSEGLKADNITYNSLMHGYYLVHSFKRVQEVFDLMLKMKCRPDVHTYNTLLRCCFKERVRVMDEKIMEALQIYEEMIGNTIKPSEFTHEILLNGIFLVGWNRSVVLKDISPDLPNYIVFLKRLCDNNCEIKSVLVAALASHGQAREAIIKYEEMKQAKLNVMPGAVGSLLEFCQSELDLDEMLKLFEEIPVSRHLFDTENCSNLLTYCIRNNHMSCANDLLKKFKDNFNEDIWGIAIYGTFLNLTEVESPNLQLCMDWLEVIIKNHEIPSDLLIECLHPLEIAAMKTKDLNYTRLLFKKYEELNIGISHIYASMCDFFLNCGDYNSAKEAFSKISIDYCDAFCEDLKNRLSEAEHPHLKTNDACWSNMSCYK